MTAVILAPDEHAAREAVFNLGLLDWIYPATPEHVYGIRFDLVVYVEGWRTSAIQSVAVGEAVELRAEAHDAERLEQPRTATMLTGAHDARRAQDALDWRRPRNAVGTPFVSPEEIMQAKVAMLRPRPRSWWARLWRLAR